MTRMPSLFVHLDCGIVFPKKLGSVTLLTLLRVNLRLIFLRVHIFVSFYLYISIIISIIIFWNL